MNPIQQDGATQPAGLSPRRPRGGRVLSFWLGGYFLVLSGAMAFLVPPYEAPDENAHLAYVDVVAMSGQIPDMRRAGGEGHQPPLYYALAGLVAGTVAPERCIHINSFFNARHYQHGGDRPEVPEYDHVHGAVWPTPRDAVAFYAVRLLSVAFGTLVVFCTVQAGPFLVDGWPGLGLAALFVATLPEFCYVSAVINNDALAVLAGAAITWAALGVGRRPTAPWRYVALGAALGVGAMTKKNVLCFWPGALFLVGYLLWTRPAARGRIARAAGLGLLAAILIAGPWLVRNQWMYGDPLGARVESRMLTSIRREKPLISWYFLGHLWTAPRAGLHGYRPVVASGAVLGVIAMLAAGVWLYWAGPTRPRARATFVIGLTVFGLAAVLLFPTWIAGARYIGIFWELVYVSFIGQFGHFKLPLPDWIHQGYGTLFVLGGAGLFLSLKPRDPDNAAVFTLALFVLTLVVGVTYYNMTYSQAHGRLLLPALPALAMLCGRGWQTLLAGARRRSVQTALAAAVAGFFLAADAVTVWKMYAYWYDPAQYAH